MDQPLTTVSAATDHAASHATDEASPLGRARATLRSYGAARLLVLGATGLGMLALFAFLLLQVSEPHFTLLYGQLELEDSSAIVGRLEALGVSFALQGEGRAILVPADQALRLRMTLAEEGLPRGGAGGDEIFDQQSLVRSAIGFDQARGDVVEVRNIPFSAAPAQDAPLSWWQLTKYDPMCLAKVAAVL
jgi:flagellar biosynthesis/type III secretory pathway M-ring protein FliF/YscJ